MAHHDWTVFSALRSAADVYLTDEGADFSFNQLLDLLFLRADDRCAGQGAKEPMMQAVVPLNAFQRLFCGEPDRRGLSAFAGVIAGALADRIGLTKHW
jgi:hypothetical protein